MAESEPLLRRQRSSASSHQYGAIRAGSSSSTQGSIITSFLIGNLHCPSCVSSINDALSDEYKQDLVWISPNIVTSVVTVEHRDTGPSVTDTIMGMTKALQTAGFEVCSVTTTASTSDELASCESTEQSTVDNDHSEGEEGTIGRFLRGSKLRRFSTVDPSKRRTAHLANCEECRSRPATPTTNPTKSHGKVSLESHGSDHTIAPLQSVTASGSQSTISVNQGMWRATLSIGGMTCASCVGSIEDMLRQKPSISHVAVNLVSNSATVDFTGDIKAEAVAEAIEDIGYDAKVEDVEGLDTNLHIDEKPRRQRRWKATVAIGGMTCASCVNAVTAELEKKEWVWHAAVNLVSNSAEVEFTEEGKEHDIIQAIEDIGYDATLDNVVGVEDTQKEQVQERTVEISIDGLYCKHCPGRLLHSLNAFKPRLEILSMPSVQRPRIKVKYTPDTPSFTIRRILRAIEASDPAFEASIYHPPTLEERSRAVIRRHQHQLLRRLLLSVLIGIPTFVIGIVFMNIVPETDPSRHFLMKPWLYGINRAQIALFILATPVYFFAADVFHKRALKELWNLWRPGSKTPILKRFYKFGSMNLLISLGATIAYVSSIFQLVSAPFRSSPEEIHDDEFYFDSVVFLTMFLLIGRLIEAHSKAKTGDAVEMLGKLRPTSAILVEKDASSDKTSDSVVNVDLVEFGDVVRVPHGSSPVADGAVVNGESSFDESSLTGESRLIKKSLGDELFAGTVNKGGPVLMRVTGAAGRSMLDQIVQVVREGQTKRAPMERVADMLTAYFVPIITLIAVLTWAIWSILGLSGALPEEYLDRSDGWVAFALQFAIAVFVVACPCGLGLAAPTAIFVGGGLAAKHGILAKGGGEAFEKASKIDVVVFDKTGTLTMGGEPKITDTMAYPDASESHDEHQVLVLIAALKSMEENSSHPIARAIVSYCKTVTDESMYIDNVEELPGRGMKATCRGRPDVSSFEMLVGNEALMREFEVPMSAKVSRQLQKWKKQAKSVALVGTKSLVDPSSRWELAACLSVSDPIRPEAVSIIQALRARGTDVWMLSGDNVETARAVAIQVGIYPSNVLAEVLPSQKAEKVRYLQSTLKSGSMRYTPTGLVAEESTTQRAVVAMVGDGINDSPALTQADVGIAVGSGSDVAISSAEFVLVSNDLRTVVTLLELSKAVFRRIRLNFAWAIVYNLLALPVAAGCLYPLTTRSGEHVRLDPVWAALAMALSSVSVVLSSLLLRTRIPWIGFRGGRMDNVEEEEDDDE